MKRFLIFTLLTSLFTLLSACTPPVTHHETVAQNTVQERGYFDLVCRDAQGSIKWRELDRPNALANVGESMILDVYFRGATAATSFYLRLYNYTPALTDTLSTLSTYEPSTANGYNPAGAPQTITHDSTGWPTLALASSHYEITSRTCTIMATGAIGPVTYAAIATTSNNTGVLVAYAALSQSRTLANGDSLQISYKVRLQ